MSRRRERKRRWEDEGPDSESDGTFELSTGVEDRLACIHTTQLMAMITAHTRETPLKTVIQADNDRETPLKTAIQGNDDRETPLKTAIQGDRHREAPLMAVIWVDNDRETPLKTVIQVDGDDDDGETPLKSVICVDNDPATFGTEANNETETPDWILTQTEHTSTPTVGDTQYMYLVPSSVIRVTHVSMFSVLWQYIGISVENLLCVLAGIHLAIFLAACMSDMDFARKSVDAGGMRSILMEPVQRDECNYFNFFSRIILPLHGLGLKLAVEQMPRRFQLIGMQICLLDLAAGMVVAVYNFFDVLWNSCWDNPYCIIWEWW